MVKRDSTRRVALAVGYPAGFEDEIVRGALDYAEQSGRWEFVGQGHRPFQPFEDIDLSAVDGVIGLLSGQWLDKIRQAGVAAVNCSTREQYLPLPRVGNDDQAIGRMGAAHLLERGFGRFGFVGGLSRWYARQRLEGFRQVIEVDAGRACDAFDLDAAQDGHDSGSIRRWLEQVGKPIAVMAENDTIGLTVMRAAAESKLRIPEDLALLGVDNDRWANALSPVPMSSVAIDARQIGYHAAQMLDGLMAGEKHPLPRWISPVGVVTRLSTDIVMQVDPVVVEALRFIRNHCDRQITVDDVLDQIDVSRRSLEMRLKRATGQTPRSAIFEARIRRAKPLLLNAQSTIGQIARLCGFVRQEQFNRVFKRTTGLTPGQFRQQRALRAHPLDPPSTDPITAP